MILFSVSASFPGGAVAAKAPCKTLDEAREEFRQHRRDGANRIIVVRTRGTNGDDRVHSIVCDWKA